MIERSPRAKRRSKVERTWWHQALQRFCAHHLAVAGAVALGTLSLATLLAPLSPYDPNRTSLLQRFEPPSLAHPMGTDDLGRDELTRILVGGQNSLAIGVLAMALSLLVGTAIGAVSGYSGGLIDSLLMRFTELVIAFPQIIALILLSTLFGGSFWNVVLALGFLSWATLARIVRASALQIREMEYILAARTTGVPTPQILSRHILPNSLGPIIVTATLGIGSAILAESTLSFFGLGIQLPTATWGNMLRAAQNDLTTAPWLAFFPGLCIFLTILSVNYVGDGLRDALDPHQR
jgi:peptide/nickel transport system permease protein